MESAWKNPIWEGSIPVEPGWMTTSTGASVPTFATDSFLFDSIMVFSSNTLWLVKISPHFPTNWSARICSCGTGAPNLFFNYCLPVVEIEIFHVSVKGLHLQGDGFFYNGVFTDDQFSTSF
jgi:hypothetical protein